MRKIRHRHRDFTIRIYRNGLHGWSGMARGLGTVILTGVHPDPESVRVDLTARLDRLYDARRGVFARTN